MQIEINDVNNDILNFLCIKTQDTIFKYWKKLFIDDYDIIYLSIFVEKVCSAFNSKYNNLLYLIIYIKRIKKYNNDLKKINWKNTFIGLSIISLKHSNNFSIENWTKILSIDRNEINKIEKETLELLNNKIYISEKELNLYKNKIKAKMLMDR